MRTQKKVKLSDIAERLNVSVVTVSNAINGRAGVSDEVREKAINLAKELGYSLPSGRPAARDEESGITVSVLVAEKFLKENQSFYWKLYQHLSGAAFSKKCVTLLEIISEENETGDVLPDSLKTGNPDGIMIMGPFKDSYMQKVLKAAEIPAVSIDYRIEGTGCDSVVGDNITGGYELTKYLLSKGHKKIGYVGTLHANRNIDDRFLGYMRAHIEHGLYPKQRWIIEDRDRNGGFADPGRYIIFDPKDLPTAFFCNCDETANMLIKKLEDKGIKVPKDISVVGFDNYLHSKEELKLTTYETDMEVMARQALEIMLRRIKNKDLPGGTMVIRGRFVEGKSVKAIGSPIPEI